MRTKSLRADISYFGLILRVAPTVHAQDKDVRRVAEIAAEHWHDFKSVSHGLDLVDAQASRASKVQCNDGDERQRSLYIIDVGGHKANASQRSMTVHVVAQSCIRLSILARVSRL